MSGDPDNRGAIERITEKDLQPAADSAPAVPRRVVPRWIQLVALPLLVLGVYEIAKAAGPVLLIFTIAAVVALILTPVVGLVQRARLPRGLAIAAVYLAFFGLLAGAGILLANPISKQVTSFQKDLPKIADSANKRLADVQAYFDRKHIHIQIKKPGETALQTLQDKAAKGTNQIVSFGTDLLTKIVTAGFALILIFVLSIYMLIYGRGVGDLARSIMPPGNGTKEDDYPTRVVRAVGGYVRGQLLFSLAMGTGAAVGLYILGAVGIFPDGKTYALAFGVFFGFMELIPYVGPFLGAAPPVLVALFQDPLTALWVTLFFVGLQQIEGHIVAPMIFGSSLRINPLFVIFALLLGAEVYGIVGALIALPVLAVLRETVVYLREHLVLEPWGTTDPVDLATGDGGATAETSSAETDEVPCPSCGAAASAADSYCRVCGSSLERAEVASGG
jgi:predicted PurR-regulated permease PerM